MPVRASPSARPAADKIPRKALHSDFSSICGLRPFNNANSLRACQHRRAGKTNEQPVLDDARYRSQQSCQARSIGYTSKMGIDDPVATIGDKNVAVLALSDHHLPGNATFRKCLAHGALRRRQAERNTSTGNGKWPSTFDPLNSSAITIMRSTPRQRSFRTATHHRRP